MIETVSWNALDESGKMRVLQRAPQTRSSDIRQSVAAILGDVRGRGDQAVVELTARYDGIRRDDFRVSDAELQAACQRVAPALESALDAAWNNIHRFHQAGRPAGYGLETGPGVHCQARYCGIGRVGLYAPGGTTPLPSSVLMMGVPAQIAGCGQVILCTAPNADGTIDPGVAWAARRCQIRDIFLIGGAQAIAAMAAGTPTVPPVNKLFGPGSVWVTEAKQQVAASELPVTIDMPAGPSEVMVIADASACPRLVAADLLAQLEHGVDSQAILVTTDPKLARQVDTEIADLATRLLRAELVQKSLRHSRVILAESLTDAVQVANRYAAEHLIIQTENARQLSGQITAAGSIFLGPWTPEVLGDYCSGTNHVLPTSGYAASISGLSVVDFMKRITVQEATRAGLAQLGPVAAEIAESEGLTAHALAITTRLDLVREVTR